jgi:DNA-damage-inducible protein D
MNDKPPSLPETRVAVFKGKEIRKTIHNNEWWFSVADVIGVLTESTDVRQYIKKMRQRDPQLDSYWGTICTPLELLAPDGKKRETNCSNKEE